MERKRGKTWDLTRYSMTYLNKLKYAKTSKKSLKTSKKKKVNTIIRKSNLTSSKLAMENNRLRVRLNIKRMNC